MNYEIIETPKDAGRWVIGGTFNVSVRRRPSKWNQFWVKLLLGWEWRDDV